MFTYDVDDDVRLELQAPDQAAEQFQLVEASRDFLTPWMDWMRWVHSEADMQRALAKPLQAMAEGKTWGWTIRYRGETAGRILLSRQETGIGEIGYWLGEAYTGHGVMARAAQAVIDWGFSDLGLQRIDIHIEADNAPSRAVAERLGAHLDVVFREETLRLRDRADLCAYGVLAADWQLRSRPVFAHELGNALTLRLQQLDDADAMFHLLKRHATTLRSVLPRLEAGYSLRQERSYTKRMLRRYADGRAIFMGFWHEERLIGSLTAHIQRQNHHVRLEIGVIPQAPSEIAVRALRAVMHHAFDTLHLHRCWMRIPATDLRQQEVAVASGLRHEGVLREWMPARDTRTDMLVVSQLRDDWEARTT